MVKASTQSAEAGHLAFYETHQISPVRYQATSIDEHLDRRDSLYRSVGLPPVAFKGARVLEVAPGSGQNSLYVASCLPATFDLVEPNPTGREQIESNYRAFNRPHTAPQVHGQRLEEYSPAEPFDIVVCENWLGSLPNEIELIRKLAGFTAPGGVLVLTITPASGLFANIMRKLMALRLVPQHANFEEKTKLLVDVFGPHLATIASMTRSHADWVIDCMINPHYLNIVIPLETVLAAIGSDMEMLATFPRFDIDWRWFKALTGEARDFNNRFLASYRTNAHNFIDYRQSFAPLEPPEAAALDAAFADLHRAALADQDQLASDAADPSRVSQALSAVAAQVNRLTPALSGALDELISVWSQPTLRPEDVSSMTQFGALFGRETVYITLTRPRT
jgi:2-polyprenyl-3-methyl-5-hydroxy-6-metoxy-1,4-benzoquinol methylase